MRHGFSSVQPQMWHFLDSSFFKTESSYHASRELEGRTSGMATAASEEVSRS
jgi:hypothetical protein